MFFSKKKGLPIETLIGPQTSFTGNFSFSGGLRLDGSIQGNVISEADKPSMLVVSETAKITGEVRVKHLILNGVIVGPVDAELLELQPHAKINGAVTYMSLEMHPGAVVDGQLKHHNPEEMKLLSHVKSINSVEAVDNTMLFKQNKSDKQEKSDKLDKILQDKLSDKKEGEKL